MKKRLIAIFVVITLISGYYFWKNRPTNVIATGTVESKVSRLGTKIGGRVAMINFEDGQNVKMGDVIVELDNRIEKERYDMAEARLHDMGNIKISRGEFEIAKLTLEETKIVAPFDGVVDLIAVEVGDMVSPNLPIVQIRKINDFEITAYASEQKLKSLKIGDTVKFKTEIYDELFDAKLIYVSGKSEFVPKQISTKEDRELLVYKIKLLPVGNLDKLKSGMYVEIHH